MLCFVRYTIYVYVYLWMYLSCTHLDLGSLDNYPCNAKALATGYRRHSALAEVAVQLAALKGLSNLCDFVPVISAVALCSTLRLLLAFLCL